jgi:hypothetical protein
MHNLKMFENRWLKMVHNEKYQFCLETSSDESGFGVSSIKKCCSKIHDSPDIARVFKND